MKLFYFVLFIFCTACSSLPQEQCSQPDWTRIGYIDGEQGNPISTYHQHLRSCDLKETPLAFQEYQKAREKGLETFCTPENGYKVGAQGFKTGEACSKQKYPDFSEQFLLGRNVYDLKTRREEIRASIDKANEQEGSKSTLSQVVSLLIKPSNSLQRQEENLNDQISNLEKESVINYDADSISTLVTEHGDTFYDYGGAVVGTFIGFGVGHALQGRYQKEGWKWTLGEIASLSLIAISVDGCSSETINNHVETRCQGNSWSSAAMIAWLGVRVWQSYNLFSYANKKQNIYTSITPSGLIITYRF